LQDSTVTGLNTHGTSCGGRGNEKIFFIDLPAGHQLTIGMSTNNYDSRHETRWGGSCPGQNAVRCTDDPDSLVHTWSNNQGSTQRTYFVVDAYSTGRGTFTLTWSTRATCLGVSTSTADAGYNDNFRGWYDVQGCGQCNDYCRWVGNSGSGGNPANLRHGSSWWSCRLAGGSAPYSVQTHFSSWSRPKCSGQGGTASLQEDNTTVMQKDSESLISSPLQASSQVTVYRMLQSLWVHVWRLFR